MQHYKIDLLIEITILWKKNIFLDPFFMQFYATKKVLISCLSKTNGFLSLNFYVICDMSMFAEETHLHRQSKEIYPFGLYNYKNIFKGN